MNDQKKTIVPTKAKILKKSFDKIYNDMLKIQESVSLFPHKATDTQEQTDDTVTDMETKLKSIHNALKALEEISNTEGTGGYGYSLVGFILHIVGDTLTLVQTFVKGVFKRNFSTAFETAKKEINSKIRLRGIENSIEDIDDTITSLEKDLRDISDKARMFEINISLKHVRETIADIRITMTNIYNIASYTKEEIDALNASTKKHNSAYAEPNTEYSVSSSSHLNKSKDKEKGGRPI